MKQSDAMFSIRQRNVSSEKKEKVTKNTSKILGGSNT